jgi:hypothetical protein
LFSVLGRNYLIFVLGSICVFPCYSTRSGRTDFGLSSVRFVQRFSSSDFVLLMSLPRTDPLARHHFSVDFVCRRHRFRVPPDFHSTVLFSRSTQVPRPWLRLRFPAVADPMRWVPSCSIFFACRFHPAPGARDQSRLCPVRPL